MARPPVFLMLQTACLRCGQDVEDPLILETWGRYCSPRCYYRGELRALRHQGA